MMSLPNNKTPTTTNMPSHFFLSSRRRFVWVKELVTVLLVKRFGIWYLHLFLRRNMDSEHLSACLWYTNHSKLGPLLILYLDLDSLITNFTPFHWDTSTPMTPHFQQYYSSLPNSSSSLSSPSPSSSSSYTAIPCPPLPPHLPIPFIYSNYDLANASQYECQPLYLQNSHQNHQPPQHNKSNAL